MTTGLDFKYHDYNFKLKQWLQQFLESTDELLEELILNEKLQNLTVSNMKLMLDSIVEVADTDAKIDFYSMQSTDTEPRTFYIDIFGKELTLVKQLIVPFIEGRTLGSTSQSLIITFFEQLSEGLSSIEQNKTNPIGDESNTMSFFNRLTKQEKLPEQPAVEVEQDVSDDVTYVGAVIEQTTTMENEQVNSFDDLIVKPYKQVISESLFVEETLEDFEIEDIDSADLSQFSDDIDALSEDVTSSISQDFILEEESYVEEFTEIAEHEEHIFDELNTGLKELFKVVNLEERQSLKSIKADLWELEMKVEDGNVVSVEDWKMLMTTTLQVVTENVAVLKWQLEVSRKLMAYI